MVLVFKFLWCRVFGLKYGALRKWFYILNLLLVEKGQDKCILSKTVFDDLVCPGLYLQNHSFSSG